MSAVLVDIHIALWALGDPARLTENQRALLIDPAVDRLSPMSVWEAAIKRQAGRLRAPRNLSALLAAEFRMLALDATLLEAAAELPPPRRPVRPSPYRTCASRRSRRSHARRHVRRLRDQTRGGKRLSPPASTARRT